MERAIFINYRGEDSHSYGALLHRDLIAHFGEDLVFLDVESIPAGADFVEELQGRVRSARVLLAVIGQRWLTAADPTGRRRIDDPEDWIRRELVEAFGAGVRVIPVLTDQAELPHETDLPADIAALSRCQYRRLRHQESTSDLARLVTDLTTLDPRLAGAARNRDTGFALGTVVPAVSLDTGVRVHPPAACPIITVPRRCGTVPPRPAAFQARAATDQLATALQSGTTAVLTSDSTAHAGVVAGMGGVGKTQVAVEYAERLWSTGDVTLVIWVTATSRDAILSSYTDLATDLTGIIDAEPERGARRLLELLATLSARWLIVLDDVQNPADLRGLWPPDTPTGRTVVTTRRRDAALRGHGRTLIEVDVFTPQEAHAYLDTVLADHPHLRHGMAPLAAAVGYLPLALAQASAYLLDRDLSCADYLTRWVDQRQRLVALVPEPEGLPDEHQATVAVTWSLSVEQANRLEPAGVAQPLLEVASVLDANGIPASLFTAPPVVELVAATVGREVSAAEVCDGLGCLRRLSLLTLDPDLPVRAVRVHALVQRATRDTVAADRLPVVVRAASDALLHIWPAVERDTVLGDVLRANAAALTAAGGGPPWVPDTFGVWFRAGTSVCQAGLVADARDYFQPLCIAAMDRLSPDRRDVLIVRDKLARWRERSGEAAETAAAYNELLTDSLRRLGPDHPNALVARDSLDYWRGKSGDTAETVIAYEELLTDGVRLLGPDHADILLIRSNLAWWRGQAGDVVGAMAMLEEQLADRVRLFGPDHPDVLLTRDNLAHWYGKSGDVIGAMAMLEELLADRVRLFGPDHPDVLFTRDNLAHWRGKSGDVAGAVIALEELLIDSLRVLGPDHPSILILRSNLAWRRKLSGDAVGAMATLEQLLIDRVRTQGPDDPATLLTRDNIAAWRGESGDVAGAVAALEELLADRLRILGPDHPSNLLTRYNLAHWRNVQSGQQCSARCAGHRAGS